MTMKAKVKNSGEIVEVKEWRGASDVVYSTLDMNTFYQASDLDFHLDPPQHEATISGWVCRDKDGELIVLGSYPERDRDSSWWLGNAVEGSGFLIIDSDLFPSLTWQHEPIEVEITIKPKKR